MATIRDGGALWLIDFTDPLAVGRIPSAGAPCQCLFEPIEKNSGEFCNIDSAKYFYISILIICLKYTFKSEKSLYFCFNKKNNGEEEQDGRRCIDGTKDQGGSKHCFY
jgi:hypothetical protein